MSDCSDSKTAFNFVVLGPNFHKLTAAGQIVTSWNQRAVFYLGGTGEPGKRNVYKLDCNLSRCQWVLHRSGAFDNKGRRLFTAAIIPRWMATCTKP